MHAVAGAAGQPALCVQGELAWNLAIRNDEHGMVGLVWCLGATVTFLADHVLIVDTPDRLHRPALGIRDMAVGTGKAGMRTHLDSRGGSRGQKKCNRHEPDCG